MSDSRRLSRRAALATAGLALPFIGAGRAGAADGMAGMGGETSCTGTAAGAVTPLPGPPRKLTIAWNETAVCTAAVPVAKEKGFFARHNLDIDYVNFAGATDQLLEALSTGKADGAPGMALRWLKPLQQGFDVKLVAGLHAGCMYLLAPPKSSITQLSDLRGKTVGVTDMGGPDRNFFGIRLKEIGIDPETEVQWRQYPPDLLPIALQRGDVQAITDGDPFSYLQKRQFGLVEIDSNMHGDWAHIACCVIGLRGSLIRNEPQVAIAVTRAILDAGAWLACNPDEAGRIFKPYAPKASAEDIATMIRIQGHHHQTRGGTFRDEIALYARALKDIGVFRPSFDTARYATRVTQDLFTA
ncbi:ABC transporter substrate-binding protein [Gluconacetobacter azotocaptans]|uniref:ABC transporter substrate-binding protein n=1 Tax=Gluconacetobacter azotocaptans TaxID=142834 RepID=A0A7W4JQD8_9PROT|nr:ABC transporter substrate-binding protein [Gluconacetobacter azotocaptans]MBB2188981.1 ABC transporter substrate-binding protein [Gluconacetobacter azotocaptans]MBM9401447.1 ABC transporter substrate-binding protein [Gluconacetobacter azotocaptans]GBQ25838.1 putative nitrate transport protein NrtA [Gluconacetobacter azotocaptans DSM 13594]